MKKILAILAIAGFASCNNAAKKEKEAAMQAQQQTIDSLNMEIAKQRVIDSMTELQAMMTLQQPVMTENIPQRTTRTRRSNYSGNSGAQQAPPQSSTVVYQQAPAATPASTPAPAPTPAEQKRKGWSSKAKGAIIGGGVGAVTGAVISDKKGKGAIIGGVSGALIGLGAGAIIDGSQRTPEEREQRRQERRARREQ